MSTLSIHTPQVSTPSNVESDVDTRFDALVRSVVPTQRDGQSELDFETVFDLDYFQPVAVPARVTRPDRSVRAVKQRPVTPKRVRLTRRGRIALVLTFLTVALALMVPFGGWATATLTGGSPEPVRIVEVQPGDTLYGIAGDLAKPGHIREMIHRIQELNSLPGGQIPDLPADSGREDHVGGAVKRVGRVVKTRDDSAIDLEIDLCAFAAADPISLQQLDPLRPIKSVQLLDQPIGVGGDAQHPLPHRPPHDREATDFTFAVDDLFVREHRSEFRAPIHRHLCDIGEPDRIRILPRCRS